MPILAELLEPTPLESFLGRHLRKEPFALPYKASPFCNLINWQLISEILPQHDNCWLVRNGRLSQKDADGKLTLNQAKDAFKNGETLLIRNSEKAHQQINTIAQDFRDLFKAPIDVQIYCTPGGHEGFDWHYDLEDVFVIQSVGEKEFYLRKNKFKIGKSVVLPKTTAELALLCDGPEIRCTLKAGDWLYIPAGYWHKARALTDSFHFSVGALFN
jgi:50S ribosomal protein L16 3-hydroxylase